MQSIRYHCTSLTYTHHHNFLFCQSHHEIEYGNTCEEHCQLISVRSPIWGRMWIGPLQHQASIWGGERGGGGGGGGRGGVVGGGGFYRCINISPSKFRTSCQITPTPVKVLNRFHIIDKCVFTHKHIHWTK